VELRGATTVAARDQAGASLGTVFLCYYGDDAACAPSDDAFITLAGDNAGLNGIRIVYPENGPYDSDLTTTYTVRGKAEGVYIVNSSIVASAYGVDFSGCDNHFIKKVTTCCYYNTFLLGGKGGYLSGCLQNGTVLSRTSSTGLVNWLEESKIFADLFDSILRLKSQYIIIDGAEGQRVFNTFCYGSAVFAVNRNSEGTLLINIGSDNIGDAQLIMESGSLAVINAMRYNGVSYKHISGELLLYNRITINEKDEGTTEIWSGD
jgi:hypothetical protein